jgi:hypothetical protein
MDFTNMVCDTTGKKKIVYRINFGLIPHAFKINELESNSKNKNIRDLYNGITEFKMGYEPSTNPIKDERGDLLVDPHKIVIR